MSEGRRQLAARGSRLSEQVRRMSERVLLATRSWHQSDVANKAFDDVKGGIRLYRVWVALASEDIGDQHRRTILGPIWLLLSYLIYIGAFMVVFGGKSAIPNFVGYVSIGMLIFMFLQEVMLQSVLLFSREEGFIAGTTLPFSVYVMRLTMQSVIRSGYSTLGCLGILFLSGTPVTLEWLWALLGLCIILISTPALITVFAMGGAFFPDLQYVVSNLIRVSMFLTPIFWVSSSGLSEKLYLWNPLTHFIDIVRTPIIDGVVPLRSFAVCISIAILLWVAAIYLLGKFRRQIVFLIA